jgi:N-ethylmaleimide reductase
MAYVHIVDHSSMGAPPVKDSIKQEIHGAFGGKIILSGGYDRARAEADLEAKKGELVAFGRPFIANPKLVTKMKNGTELRTPDQATFYTPGPKGYIDYPID